MLYAEFYSKLTCGTGPALCTDPEEILLRRFHPNDPGLLLITAAKKSHPQLTSISRPIVLAIAPVLLVSLVIADSAAPADQKLQVLNSNFYTNDSESL